MNVKFVAYMAKKLYDRDSSPLPIQCLKWSLDKPEDEKNTTHSSHTTPGQYLPQTPDKGVHRGIIRGQ